MRIMPLSTLLLVAGCQMTPISPTIALRHGKAQREVPILERVLKEGDIIFRLSSTRVGGGLVDFSKEVAKATDSQMSHATLIYKVGPDGVLLVDIAPEGIARKYLVDWYIDGCENIVVRRLKPEFAYLIPPVLAELERLVAQDVLYDDKFRANDDRYYCTELVDHCFRTTGHPLAPRMRIRDFPHYNLIMRIGCLVGRIDDHNQVAFAGNENIGLFSSPMLETVLDWRNGPPAADLAARTTPSSKQEPDNPIPASPEAGMARVLTE